MDEIKKLRRKKEKAITEKNYEQLYHYCKEVADIYLREENNESALREYKEAEEAAKILGNKLYIAVANRMIGETLCALGEFEEAVQHQKVHLTYSRDEGNLVEEQRAFATLGRTYFVRAESLTDTEDPERKQCLDLCRKYYLKSLNICDRLSTMNQLSQRTLAEMKLRLFLNLGLSSESQGNTPVGIEFISKAINIAKNMELWEDLCRCYTSQGSLYFRQGSTAKAVSAYDEALKLAERVEKKTLLSCELLSLKSDVLITLSDYIGAKNVLIKAYKLKTPDTKERSEIEEKLKSVVLICKSENQLLNISETDYNTRKKLNETLGDCCVKLRNYEKAIHYYLTMLECAVALGLQGKELTAIYYSIAQTYKDNKQYKLSIEYSWKEFEILKDNPSEACKTMLNLTDTMELLKEDPEQILKNYEQALILAKKSGDLKIEATVLKIMLQAEREYGKNDLADETEKELNVIKCCLPEVEEESEVSDVETIPDDINLDELSDLNTDEEEELPNREKYLRRRVPKSIITRRNEKGETPLHVASAKGNIQLIKSLLKQGHPVNVQDAAGWSPLHEACNQGNVEAARILIESGADIDDRGGRLCDGLTPLIDAALNGHTETMNLLLDKGASPLARDNKGKTALEYLLLWRQQAEDSDEDEYYHIVVRRLQDCLNKVGQTYHIDLKPVAQETQPSNRMTSSPQNRSHHNISKAIDHSRKCVEPELQRSQSSSNAAREYQDAIEALRRRNKKDATFIEPINQAKKGPLWTEDDVGDDWLEDDLENLAKRPTKRRCEQFVGQQMRKKISKSHDSKEQKTDTPIRWDDIEEYHAIIDDELPGDLHDTIFQIPKMDVDINDEDSFPSTSNLRQRTMSRTKSQKTLLSLDFKRFRPSSSSTQESVNLSQTSTDIRPDPQNVVHSTNQSRASTASIKIRIEGKLFLIPVPQVEEQLNVGWLAAEASRRYQNLEGVSPVLNITTEDGALLDVNDPISIVLNSKEVCASVLSWNLAPLIDRYKEACLAANVDVDRDLELKLDICQASSCLEMKNRCIPLSFLTPALKAISHHQNLQQICLSGVYLQDQGFKILIDHITKLRQLRSLNVSVNNITNDGLLHLSQTVSSNYLQMLEELDLSFNPLGEGGAHNLSIISNHLPFLRSVNLSYVGLTHQSLFGSWNFTFDHVESLNVSYNRLEREGASKFLSALDPSRIRLLDMSSIGSSEVFRECMLFLDRGHLENLEELFLSDLDLDDSDVEQLIQPLKRATELVKLDLSNNRGITISSHRHLSELINLKELHLAGCSLLTSQHKLTNTVRQLSLSCDLHLNGFNEAPYSYVTNTNELVL